MKKESGIVLGMLVAIIISMLLLAGIVISGISDDNGLFESMKKITEHEEEKAKNTQEDIKYLENNL